MTKTNNQDERINTIITINELITELSDFGNYSEDEDNTTLERAVDYYCNMSDIREGYKHALILTLKSDRDCNGEYAEDVFRLKDILNQS
jgi:hypothetical protein